MRNINTNDLPKPQRSLEKSEIRLPLQRDALELLVQRVRTSCSRTARTSWRGADPYPLIIIGNLELLKTAVIVPQFSPRPPRELGEHKIITGVYMEECVPELHVMSHQR